MHAFQINTRTITLISAVSLLLTAANIALSQTSAVVTVNASRTLGAIPPAAFGMNTASWDDHLLDSEVPRLLTAAGITSLRFPGGSTADIYHWQTQSATGGYVNPRDTFDVFMGIAKKTRAIPIITVNYGSNAAGTGGGDPNEAAAWVKYSNNTKKYGVKYWEVGNEIYGNGEYGAKWEEDLHAAHDPATYGTNVVTFVDAMKAQDPTIKVGAVLTTPDEWPDKQSPNWNAGVLAACGTKINFVIVHWYALGAGSESDAKLLSSTGGLPAKVAAIRSLIKQYCGVNAPNVQIFVTETNSVATNPGKQTVSLVNALFAADDYMAWLENGAANVDWWAMHNGANLGGNNSSDLSGAAAYGDYGVLSSASKGEPPANTPFPPYYGIQMLSNLGHSGDKMIPSSSSHSLLSVHAVKQAGGKLGVLLINKDPANNCAVSISVSGYSPATSKVYTYGKGSTSITSSTGKAAATFTQTVPPYSLTTIVLSQRRRPAANGAHKL